MIYELLKYLCFSFFAIFTCCILTTYLLITCTMYINKITKNIVKFTTCFVGGITHAYTDTVHILTYVFMSIFY